MSNEASHNEVLVHIDKVDKHVPKGTYTVVQIKGWGKVPQADELEQLIQGKLLPLPDDGSVQIDREEKFISHPRSGSSS